MMCKILVVLVLGTVATGAYAGPTSEYFLSSGDQMQIDVVQGADLLRTWSTFEEEHPIAVGDTVRTLGTVSGSSGREYTLDGTPTGSTYPNDIDVFWDSTTDGQFNYLVSWLGNDIIRTDRDYTNPVVLFNMGAGDPLGITYDPTNNSLWIAEFAGGAIDNFALDGTLLSSFNTGIKQQAALALDHADGTLWLIERTFNGDLQQFSRDGDLLSTEHYAELVGLNPLGGEFAIPEPVSLGMLLMGGLLALRRHTS